MGKPHVGYGYTNARTNLYQVVDLWPMAGSIWFDDLAITNGCSMAMFAFSHRGGGFSHGGELKLRLRVTQ